VSNRPNPKAKAPARAVQKAKGQTRRPSLALWVLVGIVGLGIVAVVVAALSQNDAVAGQEKPVTVEGTPLAELPNAGEDPAVGATAPTLIGSTFADEPITVGGPADEPTLVVFVAHWCPHCQAEVPRLVEWRADGTIPDDIRLVAVATSTEAPQPNYPPQEWLEREDWPGDVLVDSEDDTAAGAYGVNGFPFFVALHADGTVAERGSGELDQAGIDALVASLEQPS
jgi:thiol-disulfide isomerase/thioredoxin